MTASPVEGTFAEVLISTKDVLVPAVRGSFGSLVPLGESIRDEGLRHPITVWTDGTLISGFRRHRAHMMLGGKYRQIPAVFVPTVEDAAKHLLIDNEDDYLAQKMKWSEVCRLWELLRRLDEPAAARRATAARRRGVQLRRQTQAGNRPPGRTDTPTVNDYTLSLASAPFGLSETTARRLWAIHVMATGVVMADDAEAVAKRDRARAALADIDEGNSSIWSNYHRLRTGQSLPLHRPRVPVPAEPVPAARQLAAWEKSLPQLEGLVDGLTELGPANPELTWEQVGPVRARLMAVRRDLEKMINKMKETHQS